MVCRIDLAGEYRAMQFQFGAMMRCLKGLPHYRSRSDAPVGCMGSGRMQRGERTVFLYGYANIMYSQSTADCSRYYIKINSADSHKDKTVQLYIDPVYPAGRVQVICGVECILFQHGVNHPPSVDQTKSVSEVLQRCSTLFRVPVRGIPIHCCKPLSAPGLLLGS